MDREAQQILDLVIRPTLSIIGLDSLSARALITYTGQVETGYDALRQHLSSGNYGAGHSWWQIEEPTFHDVVNYINNSKKQELKRRILFACNLQSIPPFETVIWNVRFACCIARVKYLPIREALPKLDDLKGMAMYWCKYYNGGGKGTVDRFMNVCKDLKLRLE